MNQAQIRELEVSGDAVLVLPDRVIPILCIDVVLRTNEGVAIRYAGDNILNLTGPVAQQIIDLFWGEWYPYGSCSPPNEKPRPPKPIPPKAQEFCRGDWEIRDKPPLK